MDLFNLMMSREDMGWRNCTKCQKPFTKETRRPLMLPCGHTFCRDCITGKIYTMFQPRCPEKGCRQYIDANHSVDLLPLDQLLDEFSQEKDFEEKICDECENKVAEHYCKSGCGFLCTDCRKHHSTVKRYRYHEMGQPSILNLRCKESEHETVMHVTHICATCLKSCCAECIQTKHRSHVIFKVDAENLDSTNQTDQLDAFIQIKSIKIKEQQQEMNQIFDEGHKEYLKQVLNLEKKLDNLKQIMKEKRQRPLDSHPSTLELKKKEFLLTKARMLSDFIKNIISISKDAGDDVQAAAAMGKLFRIDKIVKSQHPDDEVHTVHSFEKKLKDMQKRLEVLDEILNNILYDQEPFELKKYEDEGVSEASHSHDQLEQSKRQTRKSHRDNDDDNDVDEGSTQTSKKKRAIIEQ